MRKTQIRAGLWVSLLFTGSAQLAAATAATAAMQPAGGAPPPAVVTLTAPDGIKLKATYFPAGRPGPAVLLLHACNSDRTSWKTLATSAAARGYHVMTVDYRGFGESEGERFDNAQQRQQAAEKWPGDFDTAFAWLTSQPGVDRTRIAAGGASCGVNQSVLLARRHPEVRTVILLSGGLTPAARDHVRSSPSLPIFGAASHGDGGAVETMRWTLDWSANANNKFLEYQAAGHGAEMFAVEKGLEPAILEWLDANLRDASLRPATTGAPPPAAKALAEFWDVLAKPDGRARARAIIEETRRRDPKAVLFPEAELNAYGYQILQNGAADHAVWLFELNVEAYPASANVYDSLSDALLAAGNRAEALKYAEKTLKVLATDKQVNDDLAYAIRDSAQKKIKDLKKVS